ncbi:MAG: hypothetical protein L3J83_09630, partial [Proteobacteria bacterium]|nr:hypothetical protein [Pseudomonadota bacterium]
SVPSGRAINPITKTNWEGVGVVPHIKVDAKDALSTAHIKALENLVDSSTDDELKNHYIWSLETLKSENNKIQLDKTVLESFVGSYGPRVITLVKNTLYYQRGEGTKHQLTPLNQNKFLIKDLSYFRVEFEINKGKVIAIIGLYDNGASDKNLKD